VGSKNERPGHTGFAHLFEHLMFEGSQHYDKGYFQPLQGAGAALNGSTNADRTNYWEVVPNGALELALWMESDRMGYLLPALPHGRSSQMSATWCGTGDGRIRRTAPTDSRRWRCSRRCFPTIIRITGRRLARSPISRRSSSTKCTPFSAATITRRTRRSRWP